MFDMIILSLIIFLPLCTSDTPYLLQSFPSESVVQGSWLVGGPCAEPVKTLSFLQGTDNASLEHSECVYDSSQSILTCKLGIRNASELLDLEKHPVNEVKVLILFVQEYAEFGTKSRVLDLCFLDQFGGLEELAICGYKPPISKETKRTQLHILDVPALAIFKSKIQTLLICSTSFIDILIKTFVYSRCGYLAIC